MFRRTTEAPDSALARVGLTTGRLLVCTGPALADGLPYLVGSLAQGFGNRGSDVDIHLFTSRENPRGGGPEHLFVDGVPVGIERYPRSAPADRLTALDTRMAETGAGPVSLSPVPSAAERKVLGMWAVAVPLRPRAARVLTWEQEAVVYALMLRAALCRVLLAGRLADLLVAAGRAADQTWPLCRRPLLELLCLSRGMPPLGEKWLARRVRRVAPASLVSAAESVDGIPALSRFLGWLGLPPFDPRPVVREVPEPTIAELRLGPERWLLSRYGRLASAPQPGGGDAGHTVRALECGLLRLGVDEQALSDGLEKGLSG
ncbi:hypothetical protein ACFV5N_00115 [Streptomyces sp. NPDC059853]|uniref:hypothetical protein n=1 Tax=Streptomyces sp. NPDC059853 TaxID=3346973 RepID=UPI00365240E2